MNIHELIGKEIENVEAEDMGYSAGHYGRITLTLIDGRRYEFTACSCCEAIGVQVDERGYE